MSKLTIDGRSRLARNFYYDELASRGDLPIITDEIWEFAQMAQELRDWAADTYDYHKKNGLILSNWYRSPEHNNSIPNASKNSAHLDARAMDITNVKPETYKEFIAVWHSICIRHNKIGGINLYNSYIHITDHEDKFGNLTFTVRDKR